MRLQTRTIPQYPRLHLRIGVKDLVGYGIMGPERKRPDSLDNSPLLLQIASLRTPNSRADIDSCESHQ